MTDLEMMELAALAVGYRDDATDKSNEPGLRRSEQGDFYVVTKDGWHPWNPKDDDGDALRLAVKRRMGVKINDRSHWQEPNSTIVIWEDNCARRVVVRHDGDPYAATRLAVLRAAAEVGKRMRENKA